MTSSFEIPHQHPARPIPLECGHELLLHIKPAISDPLWCYRCGAYSKMKAGQTRRHKRVNHTQSYRVSCIDCIYSRHIGEVLKGRETQEERAVNRAEQHVARLGHRVEIVLPGQSEAWRTFDPEIEGQMSISDYA